MKLLQDFDEPESSDWVIEDAVEDERWAIEEITAEVDSIDKQSPLGFYEGQSLLNCNFRQAVKTELIELNSFLLHRVNECKAPGTVCYSIDTSV